MLSLSIICFIFAGTLDDDVITKNVVGQNTVVIGTDTTHVYLCVNEQNGIQCENFKKEQKILPNKTIVYTQYDVFNGFLWFLFGLFLIIVIVGTFHPDDDMNWEFGFTWVNCLLKEVKVFEQSNKFYWVLRNKLLVISDTPNDPWFIKQKVQEYVEYRNVFPEFLSKEEKRNRKLKNIGV
jgi:hypothetical protein